ncbi:MAG: hypothetical protein ACE5IY_15860 [bacterium]
MLHFSHGNSSARCSASRFSMTRNRRCASGWAKGSLPAATVGASSGFSPTARLSTASAASAGRCPATSSRLSSSACRTSSSHSSGTP